MTDTNDKELLQMAAKAAGIEGEYESWTGQGFKEGIRQILNGAKCQRPWNPLTDDGDALRLAVKLRLRVATPTDDTDCAVAGKGDVRGVHVKAYSGEITEPYAATRRAIVRAAAAIGRL